MRTHRNSHTETPEQKKSTSQTTTGPTQDNPEWVPVTNRLCYPQARPKTAPPPSPKPDPPPRNQRGKQSRQPQPDQQPSTPSAISKVSSRGANKKFQTLYPFVKIAKQKNKKERELYPLTSIYFREDDSCMAQNARSLQVHQRTSHSNAFHF